MIDTFLKRKNALVNSGTPKGQKDHGKQLVWKTEKFFSVGYIKNTIQEVDVSVSKSTSKRRYHQSKYRDKMQIIGTPQKRKTRLESAKTSITSIFFLKKPVYFWNNI